MKIKKEYHLNRSAKRILKFGLESCHLPKKRQIRNKKEKIRVKSLVKQNLKAPNQANQINLQKANRQKAVKTLENQKNII